MPIVKCDFTISGAKTLIRALDHIGKQADGTLLSGYAIDTFCRKDTSARLRELRRSINRRLPKAYRVPE